MSRDPECIFCKIVAVELPARVVYENESLLVFLDINPLADGHLLVLPKSHYAQLADMPSEESARIGAILPKLGRSLLEVTGAQGFNVLQNNGTVAGQVVSHVHFHLIPRIEGDSLGYRWNTKSYEPGRAEQIASNLQAALVRRD